MSQNSPTANITRDDLERQFASVQRGLKGKIEDRKRTIASAITVAAVVIALALYLLGRRSGKRKTTLVEIRRV